MAFDNNFGFEEAQNAAPFESDATFTDGALDWDVEIEQESEFVLLPPGDYEFQVMDFERGRYNGGEKMGPCNKAIMHLKIYGKDGRTVTLKHNLFLHKKTEGLISEFFIGIGLKKHGEKLRMDWNATIGKRGWCKVGTRTFNGNEYNDIKRILDPARMPATGQVSFSAGTF